MCLINYISFCLITGILCQVYLEKLAKKGFVKRRWSKNNGNTFHASQNDNKCFKCGQQGHWANKCTNKGNHKLKQC